MTSLNPQNSAKSYFDPIGGDRREDRRKHDTFHTCQLPSGRRWRERRQHSRIEALLRHFSESPLGPA